MDEFVTERLYLATIAEDGPGLARQYGLGLEIDEFCTACNMDEPGKWERLVCEKMKDINRFVFHAPFNELVPVSIDPEIRAVTRRRYVQAIDKARQLGIRRLVFHTGYLPNTTHTDWYVENCAEFWRGFAAEWPDTEFLIENVFEDSPVLLRNLCDRIKRENVKLCLDIGHANCCSNISLEDWLKMLGDRIGHIHLHDNFADRDRHLPLGEGAIDFNKLFEKINDFTPGATLTVECEQAESSIRWLKSRHLI